MSRRMPSSSSSSPGLPLLPANGCHRCDHYEMILKSQGEWIRNMQEVIGQKEESIRKLGGALHLINQVSGSNAIIGLPPVASSLLPPKKKPEESQSQSPSTQQVESRAITMQEIIDKVVERRARRKRSLRELESEQSSNPLDGLFRSLLESKLNSLEAEDRERKMKLEELEAKSKSQAHVGCNTCSKAKGGHSPSSSASTTSVGPASDISSEEDVVDYSKFKKGKRSRY